jgi:hypothetical protein
MELYVDPVALLDCLHLACGSCAIKWLERSVGNAIPLQQIPHMMCRSPTCHQCRADVRGIHDSHHTTAIVEAYKTIAPDSSLCQARTPDELCALRNKYQPGQSMTARDQDQEDSFSSTELTDNYESDTNSEYEQRDMTPGYARGFTTRRFTSIPDDLSS